MRVGLNRRATRTQRYRQRLHRRERGLLDYWEKCDVEELRAFVRVRGLGNPSKRLSKTKLVKWLQVADDQRVFGRFMDLPAELRVSIYRMHLDNLQKPDRAAQPPITKVSRAIRHETLLLFYRDMLIDIDFTQCLALSGKKAASPQGVHLL